MTHRLFVNSSTGIDVTPEYDIKDSREKIETRHRTRDASEYAYTWGTFDKVKFSVTFVDSSFKAIVNSWWETNTDLLFMEVGATDVRSVHLVGKERPINKLMKPYTDLFGGTIDLEGY